MISRMIPTSWPWSPPPPPLTLSGVPFAGPVGAARVGYVDGGYVLNPPLPEMENTKLDLVVAGTNEAVLMVESEAQELPEDIMLGAVMFGHKHFQPVIDAIIRLAEKAAKEPRDFAPTDLSEVETAVLEIVEADLRAAYKHRDKQQRYAAIDAAKAKVTEALLPRTASRVSHPKWSRPPSRKSRPRSCAGPFSMMASALTGAM